MSKFIENYLRPVLLQMVAFDDIIPDALTMTWNRGDITLSTKKETFRIQRDEEEGEQEASADAPVSRG